MKATYETRWSFPETKDGPPAPSRFQPGDKVLMPHDYSIVEARVEKVFLDRHFGGWLVVIEGSLMGVHEQNFIHAAERDEWEPHDNLLWSWWTRK